VIESERLHKHLVAGERLLFSSQKAELEVFPRRKSCPPYTGPLAVTDRRIYIIEKAKLFSSERRYEAVFSPNYARQLIKETYAVDLLTDASLEKGIFGKRSLLLQVYHTSADSDTRRYIENARKTKTELSNAEPHVGKLLDELSSWIGPRMFRGTCKLQIKQPLILTEDTQATNLSADGNQWLIPIIDRQRQKNDVTYEPLVEIIRAKSQEISTVIKEYENPSLV
jgi:hypothetical protein